MTDVQSTGLVPAPPSTAERKQLLINGEWVDAASGATFETINPSTGEVITEVAEGGAEDIDRAVRAARAAFEGPWSRFTPRQRERLLLDFAEALTEAHRELVATDSVDMGFPIGVGSVVRSGYGPADIVRYFAGWPTKLHGDTLANSAGPDVFTYTRREPIGVVGAITPWNVPRNATGKIAPALAAGCTVVMKPSELAPLAPLRVAEILNELDIPPGVINMVPGMGHTAGARLAEHPDVDKLTFTGSTATGQSLVRASAGNLKTLTLELGGKSPDIIFADADLDAASTAAAMGVFGNSGQMCTAGSRLFVEGAVYEEVVERVIAVGRSLRVGHSLDPTTTIGPIASQGQLDRVAGFLESGRADGGEIRLGGERITQGSLAAGYFVPPTVFTALDESSRVASEEVFGPVASIFPFTDAEDVIRRANRTPYGLVGGVWTRDLRKANQVAAALQCGVVWVNGYNQFDPNVPFGGHKMSGWGSELGHFGVENFLKVKSVWMNYS